MLPRKAPAAFVELCRMAPTAAVLTLPFPKVTLSKPVLAAMDPESMLVGRLAAFISVSSLRTTMLLNVIGAIKSPPDISSMP